MLEMRISNYIDDLVDSDRVYKSKEYYYNSWQLANYMQIIPIEASRIDDPSGTLWFDFKFYIRLPDRILEPGIPVGFAMGHSEKELLSMFGDCMRENDKVYLKMSGKLPDKFTKFKVIIDGSMAEWSKAAVC